MDTVRAAREILDGRKGLNIRVLDVRNLTDVTDYYVFVAGNSAAHMKAMAGDVEQSLKKDGVRCYRRAGSHDSGWIVLDYIDVVIHILSAEARKYYAIEDLWAKAPEV